MNSSNIYKDENNIHKYGSNNIHKHPPIPKLCRVLMAQNYIQNAWFLIGFKEILTVIG